MNFQISTLNSTINSYIKQKTLQARSAQINAYMNPTLSNLTQLINTFTKNETNMTPITATRFFAVQLA
jgi:hypothetical protein